MLLLPLRFEIEPIKGLSYFRPVPDNVAYVDKTDEGQLWTLLFKKISKAGLNRGIAHCCPKKQARSRDYYSRNHRLEMRAIDIGKYPHAHNQSSEISVEVNPNRDDEQSVQYENMLVAYIMRNIDKNVAGLREIVGPIKDLAFFGNHVQYGISGDTVDVLVLHRKRLSENVEYRYKATVVEVKRGPIELKDLEQVSRYAKWIAQLVTFNNKRAIQPVIIGKKPKRKQVIEEMNRLIAQIDAEGVNKPIFIEYTLNGSRIGFERFGL